MEKTVKNRAGIYFILLILAIGLGSVRADSNATAKNSWYLASMFSLYYRLPIEEDNYTEEGALSLDINPRVLWFPIDRFGVGIDADFYYFKGQFRTEDISIGPSIAYYMKRPGILEQLMPYAECSVQYIRSETDPGAIESGWGVKLGLGISPIIGDHVTIPIEFGFMSRHITSDYEPETFSKTTNRIFLECGIGAFLW